MISWNKQPQLSSAELLSKLLQEAQRVFSKSADLFGDAFRSDGTPCFQLRTPQLEEIRNLEEQKQNSSERCGCTAARQHHGRSTYPWAGFSKWVRSLSKCLPKKIGAFAIAGDQLLRNPHATHHDMIECVSSERFFPRQRPARALGQQRPHHRQRWRRRSCSAGSPATSKQCSAFLQGF